VGGLTSVGTTWLSQKSQTLAQLRVQDKAQRQELYRVFIEEASAHYVDALSHSLKDASTFIGLYAKVSRMRILSSEPVVAAAEQAMLVIGETYKAPNLTLDELAHRQVTEFDPLKDFSDACRRELQSWGYL